MTKFEYQRLVAYFRALAGLVAYNRFHCPMAGVAKLGVLRTHKSNGPTLKEPLRYPKFELTTSFVQIQSVDLYLCIFGDHCLVSSM